MTVTAQQKLINAYNEFIADFCENHGNNDATRDEAHERAGQLTEFAQGMVSLVRRVRFSTEWIDQMIDYNGDIQPDEAHLVACAVAVALEEVK